MNKIAFGILTIAFNAIGVPCFIQKHIKTGILRIVLAIVTFGVVEIINMVKGIILGIQVLKMSQEEFDAKFGSIDSGFPAM